nr:MAG TPA: hypothetical protein [Caudoviricetes sp.]
MGTALIPGVPRPQVRKGITPQLPSFVNTSFKKNGNSSSSHCAHPAPPQGR